MALREIAAVFGIQVDAKPLEHLEHRIESTKEALEGLFHAFAGGEIVKELAELFHHTIELGAGIGIMAEKIGVGAEELQKFQFAASMVGVSAEGATQGLKFLSKNMVEAAGGSKTALEAFAALGEEFTQASLKGKPVMEVALDVADGLSKMDDKAKRVNVAMALFGRAGADMIPALSGGREEMEKFFKEAEALGGILSEEQVHAAHKAEQAMTRYKFALQGVRTSMTAEFLPAIMDGYEWLSKKAAILGEVIRKSNIMKVALAALGVTAVFSFGKAVLAAAKLVGVVSKTTSGVFGMIKAFAGFGIYIVAIAALVLLFEDLYTWIEGGDSLIGRFLDKIYGAGEAKKILKGVQESFEGIKNLVKELNPLMKDLAKDSLPLIAGLLEGIVRGTVAAISGVVALGQALWAALHLDGEGLKKALTVGGNRMDKALGVSDFGHGIWEGQNINRNTQEIQDKFDQKNRTLGLNSLDSTGTLLAPPGGGQPINQRNEINVTVQGGNTNAETGKAVASAVKNTFEEQKRAAASAMGR